MHTYIRTYIHTYIDTCMRSYWLWWGRHCPGCIFGKKIFFFVFGERRCAACCDHAAFWTVGESCISFLMFCGPMELHGAHLCGVRVCVRGVWCVCVVCVGVWRGEVQVDSHVAWLYRWRFFPVSQDSSRTECWQMSSRQSILNSWHNAEQAFEIRAYGPLLDR